MSLSSYWIPIGVLLCLKFSLVQSQQYAGEYCGNSFAIYENKIIRTEDSKKLGAKYLTSQDVTSRLECLKLCCVTHKCDVFIFEEKIPGTCYMFACGPPDDFRCQFTSHGNYTSAVLSLSNPRSQGGQLEEEIRLNQHETELTRLRQPMENLVKEVIPPTPSPPPSTSTTTPPPLPSAQPEPAASTQRSKCSRFQFECHTSKECIAIYNVCDGIPQCMDNSDEAAELACPTTALRSTSSSTTSHRDPQQDPSMISHNEELLPLDIQTHSPPFARMMPPPQKLLTLEEQQVLQSQQLQAQQLASQQLQTQQRLNPMMMSNQQNIQWPSNSQMQYNKDMAGAFIDPNSGMMYHPGSMDYGREGEKAVAIPWQQHMASHPNNGMIGSNNRIFGHKGNIPVQSPDYPAIDTGMNSNNNVPYKMNNMSPYSFVPAYQHVAPAQNGGLNNMDMAAHQMTYNRPPEYYYDDTTHQQMPVLPQPHSNIMEHDLPPPPEVVKTPESSSVKKQEAVVAPVMSTMSVVPMSSTTAHPHHRKEKHSKKQQMSTEILIKESVSEHSDNNFYPSSAIIVFTCSLFLTVTLVILLCCRLKMIRRRLRKGGKSTYAHDADFLVNGMYL
ncbi:hypothetical protein M8J76_000074 [Diaphorina citri]|nr:hypothetical protein M8J76_000074 [Diaphorina citri]